MTFENGQLPKPTHKHKLLAMIDEFPALGKLEILQESLAFVAGYGIKCYLISQDINQLKSRETGYGRDESITSNCHVQCAFPPNRLETAEHLSKLTGQTTIIKEQVTRSGRGFLATQVSTTMQEVQRPLLTPDECLRMPGSRKDEHDRILFIHLSGGRIESAFPHLRFTCVFLFLSIRQSLREMHNVAAHQAELEALNTAVECKVVLRTAELSASEEKFRQLSAAAPIGIFQTDSSGRCLYVNHRLTEILGLSSVQVLGNGWAERCPPG